MKLNFDVIQIIVRSFLIKCVKVILAFSNLKRFLACEVYALLQEKVKILTYKKMYC